MTDIPLTASTNNMPLIQHRKNTAAAGRDTLHPKRR